MARFVIVLLVVCFSAVSCQDYEKTGRLPRDLIPSKYSITLRPDIYAPQPPFPFTGSVTIDFRCHKKTKLLHLNAFGLVVKSSTVKLGVFDDVMGDPILVSITYNPKIDFVTFEVKEDFVVGKNYYISLEYSGVMRKSGEDGLYWDSYVDSQGRTKYIAATQLESVDARKSFPCFDEVDMKAVFRVSVEKKLDSHVAISNSFVRKIENLEDGWSRVTFKDTPLMSTYLVCIVVGEFKKVRAPPPPGTQIAIGLYATPEQAKNLEYLQNFAVTKLQKWFNDHTKFPYKEEKMDHVALPNKGGAMENWGVITYSEEILCVNNETSSAHGKFKGVTIVSHEIAHMWYGNLVTCKWWNDLWVQEGFATFYNYLPTEDLGWNWKSTQVSDGRRGIHALLVADQKLSTTHTVRKAIDTPQQSESAFTSGAYNKGGAVLRMVHGIFGREWAEEAFSVYLKQYQYSNSDTKGLLDVLNKVAREKNITSTSGAPLDFNHILDTFLNVKGYPVLSLSKKGPQTLELKQELYLNPSKQHVPPVEARLYKWELPLNLVTDQSPLEKWSGPATDWFLKKQNEHIVVLPTNSRWHIINPLQFFYYRVLYEPSNVQALAAQVKQDFKKIPAETRAQLLDDYFDFSRVLKADISSAMDFTLSLHQDLSHNSWQATLKHIHAIEGFFKKEPFHKKLLSYFRQKLDAVLKQIGFVFPQNEDIAQSFLRIDVYTSACSFGSLECNRHADEKFQQYIKTPDVNSIDANLSPTVLCNGVFKGSQQNWDAIKKQYIKRRNSHVKEERQAYAFAMTCSQSESNLESIFQDLLKGETFRNKDYHQVALYLAATPYGEERLFSYIDQNWNKPTTFDKFGVLDAISNKWYTQQQVDRFEDFFERRQNSSSATPYQTTRLTLNKLQIHDNFNFFNKQKDILNKWLENNYKPSVDELVRVPVVASPSAHQHWRMVEEWSGEVGKKYWE